MSDDIAEVRLQVGLIHEVLAQMNNLSHQGFSMAEQIDVLLTAQISMAEDLKKIILKISSEADAAQSRLVLLGPGDYPSRARRHMRVAMVEIEEAQQRASAVLNSLNMARTAVRAAATQVLEGAQIRTKPVSSTLDNWTARM